MKKANIQFRGKKNKLKFEAQIKIALQSENLSACSMFDILLRR